LIMHAYFLGYAHVSRTIWLNFTQEKRSASNYKEMNSN
jgi:hypothetical protein